MWFNVRRESSNEWWIEKDARGSGYGLSVRTVRVSGEMLRFFPFLSSRSAQRFTAIWTFLLSGSTIRNPVMLVPPCWYGSKSIVCRSWKQTTYLSFNPCHGTSFPGLWSYSVPTAFIYPYKFSDRTGNSQFFLENVNYEVLLYQQDRLWEIIVNVTVGGRGIQMLHVLPDKQYVTSQYSCIQPRSKVICD
jgi:hypothetical protein